MYETGILETTDRTLVANISTLSVNNRSPFIEVIIFVSSGSWAFTTCAKYATLSIPGNIQIKELYNLNFGGHYESKIELEYKTQNIYLTAGKINLKYSIYLKEIF